MKKKLLHSALLTLAVGLIVTPAFAASMTGQRETEAEFESGGKPEVVVPEEGPTIPEVLDPDPEPTPNIGELYVTHIPNISFGTGNKTNAKTVEHKAMMEERTQTDAVAGTTTSYFAPHSAQVVNMTDLTWNLTVAQDDVYKSANHELLNTRIRIYGSTITNNLETNASVAAKITGVGLENNDAFGDYSFIPVTTKDTTLAPLKVLDATSVTGAAVSGYTTAVFEDDYEKANYDPTLTPTAARYEGVRLNVPIGDKARGEAYTAKLTWTLTSEPTP